MFEEKTSFLDKKRPVICLYKLFKLTYRKIRWCFSSKCCLKYVVKIWKENIENYSSYGACRFEKTCFEKNAFKVPSRCVYSAGSRMRGPTRLRKNAKLNRKQIFSCIKPFASYSRRFKLNFKPKKNRFSEKFTLVLPLNKQPKKNNCPINIRWCILFFQMNLLIDQNPYKYVKIFFYVSAIFKN